MSTGDSLREDEKQVDHAEVALLVDLSQGDEALELVGRERTAQFSEEYNRKLLRKLDFIIPPLCAVVYFTHFLDKTALNYASIMGFPVTGQRYNLVSLAFYAGFVVWEIPTVYLSQKTRVAKYLGCNIVLWGAILMLHATASSFQAFFALRFLLGMCESCAAPLLILIISMFYKKSEQGSRVSWFFVTVRLAQIFGGLVAYGISFSDRHILPAWKIVYILLGGLAVLVGIAVLLWLPDSPVHARLLTREERIAALERVRNDQGGTANHRWKKDQIIEAVTDVRTWLIMLTTIMTTIPQGALSSFSNIIIKSFGYSTKQALILSTPGGVVVSMMTLFCGWYSDRMMSRMVPIVFAVVPTIIGAAVLIGLNGSGQKGALLFGIYLTGTFGTAGSAVYAYNASNASGHTKKNTVNSMTLVAFGIGNIIGTEIFQPKDAPGYIPGKVAILVILSVQIGVCYLLRRINMRMNAEKRARLEEEKVRKGWSDEDVQKERERHAFLDLTDKQNMFFVYAP